MLFQSKRLMIYILTAGAATVLVALFVACSPANDERSITESTAVAEGSNSSPSAADPARTPTRMATAEPTQDPTPTLDIQVYVNLDLPEGDALRGRNVAMRNGCRGCHYIEGYTFFALPFIATDELPAIMERGEMRIADPNYTGKATSNRAYFFESLYLPELYVVSGEWKKAMPRDFHERLTDEQDLADLLAWIAALNDPDFELK